ncbi:MAG: adenylate/guanylate cyclase domain-containing protein [Thiovulaceae bacterium]|nr:adenylate/guanylate cyclase domain-containing protein [Sulfurimonadaceae bacterium]
MKKRLMTHGLASLIVSIVLVYLYYNVPDGLQSLDNRLRDSMFQLRGPIETTGKVAIVDIDERSLRELGQWPWGRRDIAQILYQLTLAGASVIGLDMVFAEEDKRSDAYIIKKKNWTVEGLKEPEDYDAIMGDMVSQTPTVVGYTWDMFNATPNEKNRPQMTANIQYKADMFDKILEPKGITLNTAKIQDNAYSSGFFNNISDEDGIIRQVPLLMKEEGFYFTSLAFEMYRLYKEQVDIRLMYEEGIFVGAEVNNTHIPLNKAAQLFVNFRGPTNTFPYIPAIDIYNGTFDTSLVKGKLILLGTSAIGLKDIRATPFDTSYPGVEVHANVIDNLLKKDFISMSDNSRGHELLLIVLVVFLVGLLTATLPASWGLAAIAVLSYGLFEYIYYYLFTEGTVLNILFPFIGVILMTIVSLLLSYIFESRTKDLIKAKFSQKVSKDVVDELLKNPDAVNFAAMDKEITVFFSDVRSFTEISERLGSAEKLISLMNDYMTPMVDIIMQKRGTVDKFIGDAIMAYWNAPKDLEGHQDLAVQSSLDQLKTLEALNSTLEETYGFGIDIGIGLNTGQAVVGEMGSQGRSDYTAIGDPVNLASRLEGLCKPYGVRLIISEFTKAGLKEEYIIRPLDLVRVKGKELPVAIYEVLGYGQAEGALKDELEVYDSALKLYREANFSKALELFSVLKEQNNSKLHQTYVERCEHFIENPPEHFDGVFTFTTK